MKAYAVVFEKTSTGWTAYVTGLRGIGVAGFMFEETRQLIREGIQFHIEGLRTDGDPIPKLTTHAEEMTTSV